MQFKPIKSGRRDREMALYTLWIEKLKDILIIMER